MKHVMNLEMCNGKLYNAPIGPNPQKILDLCTGLGLWAVAGESHSALTHHLTHQRSLISHQLPLS